MPKADSKLLHYLQTLAGVNPSRHSFGDVNVPQSIQAVVDLSQLGNLENCRTYYTTGVGWDANGDITLFSESMDMIDSMPVDIEQPYYVYAGSVKIIVAGAAAGSCQPAVVNNTAWPVVLKEATEYENHTGSHWGHVFNCIKPANQDLAIRANTGLGGSAQVMAFWIAKPLKTQKG